METSVFSVRDELPEEKRESFEDDRCEFTESVLCSLALGKSHKRNQHKTRIFFHGLNCILEHVFPYFSTRGLFGFSPPSNLARARPRLMLGPISASGLLGELGVVVLVTSSWEFFLETRLNTQSPSSEQAGIIVMLSSSLPAERRNEEQNDNRMFLKQEGKYSNGKICSIAQMKNYSMCIVFHFIVH